MPAMAKRESPPGYLTTRGAALRLRVTVSRVNQLITEGRPGRPHLEAIRADDNTYRVSIASIRKYDRWRNAARTYRT